MISLEGYQDLKKLAEGRDRIIYSGLRSRDQQSVIVKALRSQHPSTDMIALMYHEYDVLKNLDLPGVVQVYGLVNQQNQYALILEDTQGISLKEFLLKNPIKNLSEFFVLALQMTEILGELHQQHIIHKDIKPSNFIIHPETRICKLTDFNFSSLLLHEVQGIVPPSKLEGTLAYMAPEQTGRMNMNIDYRSDFYALGVTFYEMLTGHLPFNNTDLLELVHAQLANPVPDLSNLHLVIPQVVADIVKKLMSKNPSDRYQSTIGLQADLTRCQSEYETKGSIDWFELGQMDLFDRLNLSQKLYGREAEAKEVLAAYERASQGEVVALMICGYSGIGKTMLVNEVHKPMVQHKGYFVSGKFDQLAGNTPYTAITAAFNQLARLILAEPEERFVAIKSELQNALGGVAQVMIDLAPDIELIIGPQPPLDSLPPQETQNRMKTFFKRFLHVVATKEHPLVLFIDDLQWIDSGSLNLLEYIMTDSELSHFLLLGAYRDNEVDAYHQLRKFFKIVEEEKKTISSLSLKPLTQENFQSFFMDSFARDREAVAPLANLIHKRCEGNPFFCKQVINSIYREKLLFFDYGKRQWDWDLEAITALKITDNVVDLMISKLNQLPKATQDLLQYAACIGNRFTVELLMVISQQSADEIGKALWPALQQELLISLRLGYKRMNAMQQENLALLLSKDIVYQFIHDKVQQAVYERISPQEKQQIHLKTARLLLAKNPKADKREVLFEITDNFNQALALLTEDEKLPVIDLNYRAALLARNANAYQPMANYLQSALQLLKEENWVTNYDVAFAVNCEYAWSLFLTNEVAKAEAYAAELMARAKTSFDIVKLNRLQIKICHVTGERAKSFQIISSALGQLGVTFAAAPTKIQVLLKFLKVQWLFRGHHLERLEKELPTISDPSIIAAFEILVDSFFTAGARERLYSSYIILFGLQLILTYGKPKSAPFWFCLYMCLVKFFSNNFNLLSAYWSLVERLEQENPDKESACLINQTFSYFICHYLYPIEQAKKYAQLAIEEGLESGNTAGALNAHIVMMGVKVAKARSCTEMIDGAKEVLERTIEAKMYDYAAVYEHRILSLENIRSNQSQEEEQLKNLESIVLQSENALLKSSLLMSKTNYYYFGELYEQSVLCCVELFKKPEQNRIILFALHAKVFGALAAAECISRSLLLKRWKYWRLFKHAENELQILARQVPENFLYCYLCLKGTHAKLRGRYQEAIQAFDGAIENAKKGDYYLWVALANELAGNMLVEQNGLRCAATYIQEAHYYYKRYEHGVKVHALEKRYPECFMAGSEQMAATTESRGVSSSTTTSAGLDFMSVIKASQTISGEIVLEHLFEKMLHIALENAGAEKAVFLEKQPKGGWMVAASLGKEFQMHGVPLKEYTDIPSSAINLVIRSKESLVIADARKEGRLGDDAYVARVQPKSVLCVPIMHHDQMIGLLYLENNLSVGSFTQDRVTVLQTLASQIAISLENSHHLERMERVFKKTERFVPKAFLQIINKDSVEDVSLGDCVKKDITVLFNDIRSFTTLIESRSPEDAFAFVNRYWKFMAPVIRKYGGYIDQYQGDAILAIFPGKPEDGVLASIAMMEQLTAFNVAQEEINDVPIGMGIGLSTGFAMLGVIGEEERQVAGLISDVANTAARIEGLNKLYGSRILFSGDTAKALSAQVEKKYRKVDQVRLKGKTAATQIFEVIEWASNLEGIGLHEYLELFNSALECYFRGAFEEARAGFQKCLTYYPGDKVVAVILERCVQFLETGTPKDWDGTFTMTTK